MRIPFAGYLRGVLVRAGVEKKREENGPFNWIRCQSPRARVSVGMRERAGARLRPAVCF